MSQPFVNRTILITGASRGIGKACALALAAPGVTLALTASDCSGMREVADACEAKGAGVMRFGFDLADVDGIKERVAEIQELCGPIHTLINNAGIWIESPFTEGAMDAWERALDVNLKAVMRLTRHALEGMPEGGAVIFIGSAASKRAYAGGANYCAAKFGLLGFAGALFEDIRERGIKVCSILPGVVNTDMHASDASFDQEKMIQPEDVAAAVAYALGAPGNLCPTEISLQPQRYPKRRAGPKLG